MTKKILLILGGLILVLAVAGGWFYGGMMFQRSQSESIRNAFFADRGGGFGNGNGGGFVGGGGSGNGGFFGGGGGGGAVGQIKSIDGDTITLSTPQSEVKVKLTDSTQILKTVAGDSNDLQPGERIVVRGERDSSGNVTASSIQITVNPPNQGQ